MSLFNRFIQNYINNSFSLTILLKDSLSQYFIVRGIYDIFKRIGMRGDVGELKLFIYFLEICYQDMKT